MNKIFIEYGAKLPAADFPEKHGLEVTLEFYLDGYELSIINNYEGGPRFEIEPGRERDVAAFLQEFVAQGYVYVGYQVMRVRAFSIRQEAPRNRYTNIIEHERETDVGQDFEEQRGDVREADTELAGDTAESGDSESGSIGI